MADLLEVSNLTVNLTEDKNKRLIDGVKFRVSEEKIVALVGGSGSGKTTTGLSILKLLPLALNIESGFIKFKGEDLLGLSEERMQKVRGNEISMIFQEPLYAFNPVFTIGFQIEEVLITHTSVPKNQRKEKILSLLDIVGIKDPQRVMANYPHQLSGGMRQRAMIAQAIAAEPELIIADEPTSNLDVTLQAHIIELFQKLKKDLNLSMILITHDLGVVEHLADEVVVLTQGKVVEMGTIENVYKNPQHHYTKQLLGTVKI